MDALLQFIPFDYAYLQRWKVVVILRNLHLTEAPSQKEAFLPQ
jgi:hypothetical protein